MELVLDPCEGNGRHVTRPHLVRMAQLQSENLLLAGRQADPLTPQQNCLPPERAPINGITALCRDPPRVSTRCGQRIQPWSEALSLLEKLGPVNNHRCVSC